VRFTFQQFAWTRFKLKTLIASGIVVAALCVGAWPALIDVLQCCFGRRLLLLSLSLSVSLPLLGDGALNGAGGRVAATCSFPTGYAFNLCVFNKQSVIAIVLCVEWSGSWACGLH